MKKPLNIYLFLTLYLALTLYHNNSYAMMVPHANGTQLIHRTVHAPQNISQHVFTAPAVQRIEQPELVLKAAVDQGRHDIIRRIAETHGDHYTAWALDQAIVAGNPEHVTTLKDAGVDLHAMLVSHDGSVSLHRALRSFLPEDDRETTARRIAILEILINNINPQRVPAAFQVNLCLIPESTRSQIAQLLNNKNIPKRICMDDAPKTQQPQPSRILRVYDSSIGVADVDIRFNKEQDAMDSYRPPVLPDANLRPSHPTQASFNTNLNPLQQAVLDGHYALCYDLLTIFQEPILENERFPIDALKTSDNPPKDITNKEYRAAVAIMEKFTRRMNRKIDKQLTLSNVLKAAKDHKGRTAYDIAREAKAPEKILKLLDPNDNSEIKAYLGHRFKTAFAKDLAGIEQRHTQLQHVKMMLDTQKLKVGDTITINNREYTVIEELKNK